MLHVLPTSKIYVYCPAGVISGGPELLHQLVDKLNNNNKEAYIIYYGPKEHKIPDAYAAYNIKLAEIIEDKLENIVVVAEGQFDLLYKGINIQKVLWWLSVDNFFIIFNRILSPKDIFKWNVAFGFRNLGSRLIQLLYGNNTFVHNISLKKISKMPISHAYQSEYAQNFLLKHNLTSLYPLKDYINTDYQINLNGENREDIVLYNPKKGLEYTRTLISMTPAIKWIPVQNMTRTELVSLMRKSKMYVDFGYHPGKDRLPREAAMNGCCIITGMDGSAGFFEDVPISNLYKLNNKEVSREDISKRIEYVIQNYATCINDFEYYRRSILKEKDEFERQVKIMFNL